MGTGQSVTTANMHHRLVNDEWVACASTLPESEKGHDDGVTSVTERGVWFEGYHIHSWTQRGSDSEHRLS